MKIRWLNVSCFIIESLKGTRIITDPFFHLYEPDDPPPGWSSNRPGIEEYADIVCISHGHFDHSYVCAIKGVPRLYTGGAPAEIKGVKLNGVSSYHDNYGEGGRGLNEIICMEVDELSIVHLGDYGQPALNDEQFKAIKNVDILMTPWGNWAAGLLDKLKPKVVLPCHHTTVDQVKHLEGFVDYRNKTSDLEYTKKTLPSKRQVIMLKESLESSM